MSRLHITRAVGASNGTKVQIQISMCLDPSGDSTVKESVCRGGAKNTLLVAREGRFVTITLVDKLKPYHYVKVIGDAYESRGLSKILKEFAKETMPYDVQSCVDYNMAKLYHIAVMLDSSNTSLTSAFPCEIGNPSLETAVKTVQTAAQIGKKSKAGAKDTAKTIAAKNASAGAATVAGAATGTAALAVQTGVAGAAITAATTGVGATTIAGAAAEGALAAASAAGTVAAFAGGAAIAAAAAVVAVPAIALGTLTFCCTKTGSKVPMHANLGFSEYCSKGNIGNYISKHPSQYGKIWSDLQTVAEEVGAGDIFDLEKKIVRSGNIPDGIPSHTAQSSRPKLEKPSPAQLKWCRENAPMAARDLPDDELWDLMKVSYHTFK